MSIVVRRQCKRERYPHRWLWMLVAAGVVGLIIVAAQGGIAVNEVHIHIGLLP